MSEIVRTVSTTTKTATTRGVEPEVKAVEYVTIRSWTANRLTVGGVLDFAKALQQADAPDRAEITARKSDVGHLVELTTKFEIELPVEPTPTT